MGIYECLHNCGNSQNEDEFCVSVSSSLDMFESTDWPIKCKYHRNIQIGSRFKYNLADFILKFSSCPALNYIYDVEVVDIKDFVLRGKNIKIIRFKVDMDFSKFIESRKINYSMFDTDVTSWDSDIITLPFNENDLYRPIYQGRDFCYNWGRTVIRAIPKN